MGIQEIHNSSEPVRTGHWPFLCDCRNNRDPVSEDRMKRLYQWFCERASFFHSDKAAHGTSRTVRTEVTVQQEGITMLLGGAAEGFDVCPLCGSKLAPTQAEHARLRLRGG
jgi:hypothetical protein